MPRKLLTEAARSFVQASSPQLCICSMDLLLLHISTRACTAQSSLGPEQNHMVAQ